MTSLSGKVAFVTGAARGQGRSHCIKLASCGADIVAVDLCAQIDTVAYPMAAPEDLAETVREVEKLDRRIVAQVADVRDMAALTKVVNEGTAALGSVDIIVANAGIAPQGAPEPDPEAMFRSVIDVNLIGVWHSVMAALPSMRAKGEGGSIVITSSTQGLKGSGGDGTAALTAYTASKHGVVGIMRSFANWLAPESIRVNTVHPSAVATPMSINDAIAGWLNSHPDAATISANLMPIQLMKPADISNAVAWLCSDEARYITGVALPIDAGFNAK